MPPVGQGLQRVHPHDEIQRRLIAIGLAQGHQRVYGVRRPATVQFQARGLEAGIIDDGQLHHPVPIVPRGVRVAHIQGRYAGRHKKHPIQRQPYPHLLGNGQVSDVDGVERSTHNPQAGGS